MHSGELIQCLEENPVIAAVGDDKWEEALVCPAQVIFYLSANLLTVRQKVAQAHEAGKRIMVHLDLAEGIGRDRTGIHYLANLGVDGLISTRAQLIRFAKERELLAIQRFFALDSKGVESMEEILHSTNPDLIEIMPGIASKIIGRFSRGPVPVIAGGLIETKAEVTEALGSGATAVSTGKKDLWYV